MMTILISKIDLQEGASIRKWCLNQSSNNVSSIQLFEDRPYIVPGTSPIVISGLNVFQSNTTNGGITYAAALQQASVVI